jgi:hypothetical protein
MFPLKSLTDHSAEVLASLLVLTLLMAVLLIVLIVKQRKIAVRWRGLMQSDTGQNLETILYDHLREKMRMEKEYEELARRLETLESKMETAKRHVGLVRYDAFEDVGGNQSFALAMYDDKGSGALVTGIVGRSDCRVYCKPLVNGRSERDLSQEEQRAIREAKSDGPKSIVSP